MTRPIPDDPKIRARVRVGRSYTGWGGIELRGQSSLRFPKKSYGLELRTRAGIPSSAADDDWVLQAPYNDKTLMRNAVAYAAARATGRYAPRVRFVELRLNGDYRGVYVLSERPERHPRRVRADWMLELTFGFQARRKGPFFRTPVTRQPLVWEDPERDDLTAAEARAIRRRVGAAERALYRGGDWRAHLDEAAAVDFVLVQELMRNVDAFRASTFFGLGRSGKIELGPVWDFDLSSGNHVTQPAGDPRGWFTAQRRWAGQLWADPGFRVALRARWRELRRAGFQTRVLRTVGRFERRLAAGPAGRNFRRWPVLNTRLWQNPAARGSFRAEVAYLRSYLRRRMAWMNRQARPR
jgi:hypothetical protein